MLPGLLIVLHRIYDFTEELLEKSNLTFQFKGPLAFYVFKYERFNADSELWKNLRNAAQARLNHQGNGLVPIFNNFAKERLIVNLQDVFRRLTYDTTMVLIIGADPKTLSVETPENEFAKALTDVGEAIMYKNVKPRLSCSFKFLPFNVGPRSCLGKQLATILMKIVVVEILQNYDIQVIKGQKIEPLPGLILWMKDGLSVIITKRDSAKCSLSLI
ncbi:hypothetical protein EUTSA_v10005410mg [Eutrema salsugineum]|uniref:Cytochrome P450 n=1 Tax=Eutrema salsugineum TaxID=72664 RepID=V4K585_EUTSA|nr:hypothetical protein EUTSA_v10005410mg [Eutrema salsugineum]